MLPVNVYQEYAVLQVNRLDYFVAENGGHKWDLCEQSTQAHPHWWSLGSVWRWSELQCRLCSVSSRPR